MTIDANSHRVLSDAQSDWPRETLRNPEQDPLIALEAMLRGFLDMLHHVLEACIDALPEAMQRLSAGLVAALGERWWERPEFCGFTAFVWSVHRDSSASNTNGCRNPRVGCAERPEASTPAESGKA